MRQQTARWVRISKHLRKQQRFFQKGWSADILVRSKPERADMRRKFQSGGADERCCGQECPRSGLVSALSPGTLRVRKKAASW